MRENNDKGKDKKCFRCGKQNRQDFSLFCETCRIDYVNEAKALLDDQMARAQAARNQESV